MLAEKAAGPQRGRLGRPDLDQRRELRRDEGARTCSSARSSRRCRTSATSTPRASPRRSSISPCRPTASRRPGAWRSSCSSTTAPRWREPPRSIPALLDWADGASRPLHLSGAARFRRHDLPQARAGRAHAPIPRSCSGRSTEADFAAVTAPLWPWLEAIRPHLWRQGATFPVSAPALHQLLDDGEVDFSMAFNPAEASAAIAAGGLPDTVRTFVLEAGTIGNTHFVAIPFNAAPPGRRDGGRRLPDVAGGAGAQAGPAGLGRRHRARRRSAAACGPRALRGAAARHRDACRPRRSCRSARSPIRPGWSRSRPSGCAASAADRPCCARCPALTLLVFLGPVAAGLLGTLLPAFGYLPALGGDGALARAVAAARGARRGSRRRCGSRITSGLLATLLALAADHPRVRRRPRHARADPGQARDDAAARGAAPRDRGRARLPDRAVGLARAPGLALADRLADAARPRAGAGPLRPRADPRPGRSRRRRSWS